MNENELQRLGERARREVPPVIDVRSAVIARIRHEHGRRYERTPWVMGGVAAAIAAAALLLIPDSFATFEPWLALLKY